MVGQLFDIQTIHIPLEVPKTPKILIGKRREPSQAQNTQRGVYRLYTHYASTSKKLFPEVAELKLPTFQDKKEGSFDTRTRTHKHNLDVSADDGAQPPLFMFEFDSHQVLLRLLLCYVLLVHQLYFRLMFLLVFIDYFPF